MEKEVLLFASRFAKEGFFVFPFYQSKDGPLKPYGWARNTLQDEQKAAKAIPATDDLEIIQKWPELVDEKYNSVIAGYGVMGLRCVIFDLDNKNGKNGSAEFKRLQTSQGIPKPEFVVKTKSGGYHLYYARTAKFRNMAIKSVAGAIIGGEKYDGIDVRGNGGMVVGPLSEGPEESWKPGVYQIIKGSPSSILSEIPEPVTFALGKAGTILEQPHQPVPIDTSDELEILKRGEIPPALSNGNRNNGFYLYLNALRNKGIGQDSARRYVQELIKVTEDAETLHESVDIEDMISRIWRVDLNNPYDTCRDLITMGLYRLTRYRSGLTYVILKDNPYLDSRDPHDIGSMKQLLARYARKMANNDGKQKLVNPAELIDGLITPDREVSTIGFKPGAPEVFTLTEAKGGRRFLNTWHDPRQDIVNDRYDPKPWEMFKFLVSRIFGPEGSDEYQLGLDFPAWVIQYPGLKPAIAPFIMSRVRGAGKSLYLNVLSQIMGHSLLGDMQAQQCKVDEIAQRFFNPNGSSILMFDEVQFPVHRNMRQESTNFWRHLKNLVTGEKVSVEYKGGDTIQMPAMAAIILSGNTGNNFPFEEFDRRIWLIDNDPPELEEGPLDEFFDLIKNKLPPQRQREIINSLLISMRDHRIRLPLDRMRAPMNEIKREMYLSTLSDIEEWWLTYFEDRENLLAATAVLSKSAIIYLISTSERLINSRWREDPESTFRELKRRNLIQPIRVRGNNYQTRNIRGVSILKGDGSVMQEGEGRDVLYTTRDHGLMNNESNDAVVQAYNVNLNTVAKYKKKLLSERGSRLTSNLG